MGLRHRPDDREPEAERAAAVARAAHEALEDAVAQVGVDARPVVLDGDDRAAVLALHAGADRGARRRVADGVLHEVQHEAVQLVASTLDHHVAGVDVQLVAVGDGAELARGLHEDVADVGGHLRRLTLGVRAREQQEIGDEAAHPAARAQRGLRRLPAVAVERLGEQLEVGEDAGERRAQLVRGVGHELPLALQGGLLLRARLVERDEHAVQRARQLRDLVVGLSRRDPACGVARALDLARGRRERGDRRHRAGGDPQPREEREPGPAEHADEQEEAHAVDRRLHVGERPRVLHVDVADEVVVDVRGDGDAAVLDSVAAQLDRAAQRRGPEPLRRAVGLLDDLPLAVDDLDGGVGGAAERVEPRAVDVDLVAQARVDDEAVAQAVGRAADLRVEVRVDALRGQRADRAREGAEDDQRQERGAAGEPPADRDALRRGERSPRRGSYGGAWALHRLPAFSGGSTRRPRWCSWSRRGRSPTPPRGGAGGGPRCVRCA